MSNPDLSVVFSTRQINEKYITHIKKTCGVENLEIIPFENNGIKSLCEVYNEGLESSNSDIVIFCHDDLMFETLFWGNKILRHFKNNPEFGIIGIAGTNYLVDGRWWSIRESMHGIVNHSDGQKKWCSKFSKDLGLSIKEMVVLDGLFFAVDKRKIQHRFDTDFKGFHFYDLSFFLPNFLSGVKIGVVTNILVTHFSIGQTNQQWEDNKKLFEEKYADKLPIAIQ